jgi:hypothetical protein
MPFPVAIVEIAFGASDTPYTLSPTWTDVTSDIRSMSVDRGRSDDWGNFTGSATVVLDNRSRKYDPFNTSSPYNGKLTPRRQIRIRSTFGGTTYDVFRGFVDGWPAEWNEAGKDSTVSLSCFDALQLLASNSLPADWAHKYILTTAPRHYWPCNEPVSPFVTTNVLKDYGSVPLNMTTSTVATSGGQLAEGLVNSSVQGTGGSAASSATGSVQGVGNFSASLWAIYDTDSIFFTGGITYNCAWNIEFEGNTSTYLLYMLDYNSNVQRQWRTTNTFDGGTSRFFAFTFNSSSKAITFYIDGVAQTMTTVAPTGIIGFPVSESYFLGSGQTQQFVVWDGIVSGAVFQEIYKYSTVSLPETTSARVNRIIAETPFSSSLVSVPASPAASVLDITDDAPTVNTELQKVADSEYAPLFVSKSGVVTLYQQNQIRTQTKSLVSQVTYGNGGIPVGDSLDIQYDGDSMRNVANVTMSKGGVYVQTNTASRDAYGQAEYSLDTQVSSLANAVSIANISTGWGGQIYPIVSPFEVVLSPSGDWSGTLALELNERITLNVSPPNGTSISLAMLVNRITHSFSMGQWSTTLEGSVRWASVFIINKSLIGGLDLLG